VFFVGGGSKAARRPMLVDADEFIAKLSARVNWLRRRLRHRRCRQMAWVIADEALG
jgi:hypothetical protein